jgi:sterol desaturase/sphingolipid hydroxylase (fatty acid hydroxylase superfamily)
MSGPTTTTESVLQAEPMIRLGLSLGLFAVLAAAEAWFPRRRLSFPRSARWPHNLGITVLDTLVVRLLLPTSAVGFAVMAESRGWGLLHALTLPAAIEVSLAVLVLDLAIYAQHVLFHHVPVLWRFHRMHHADLDFDVTTGTRFHPVEILLSLGIKFAVVCALGASPGSVLLFEALLNGTSLFNHTNLRLPAGVDRLLRCLVVTPDMHRVHHSIVRRETDSNFGFNFPWWDRLFGTYRAQPEAGHAAMTIGLEQFRDPKELRLDRMLTQPLREH